MVCREVLHEPEESPELIRAQCNHVFHNKCTTEDLKCPICVVDGPTELNAIAQGI